MVFLLLWALFGHHALSGTLSELPVVRWYPSDVVEPGETLRLDCQVSPFVAGPAIWLKLDPQDPNNHEVISHGELLIRQDDRLSVSLDAQSNTYSLTIDDVSPSDDGGYQCQVPIMPDEEEVQAAAPVIIQVSSASLRHQSSKGVSCSSSFSVLALFSAFWANLMMAR